ncbi:MAG: hypothetical protein QM497_01275 [Sulfurimonas sp.]
MSIKFLFYLFIIPTLLLGSNTKSITSQIDILFEKKDYEAACQLVDKLYKNDPYNSKANVYYGKCKFIQADVDSAMAAYDRADILDEEDAFVHKNLGDLYAHTGNIEIANKEYDKADRFGKDIVERSLDALYSHHSFSVLARISGGYDSNVKYTAELSDMKTYTGDTNYTNEANSDSFLKEYMRLSYIYDSDPYNPFYYKSQLHVYNKNYSDLSEDDFTQSEILSGPGWASKDFDIWIPLSYTYMSIDYDGYGKIYAINPQIRKKFENDVLLSAELRYEYQKYLQWDEGDKDVYSGRLSLSRWFGNHYLRASYRYLQADKHQNDSPRIFIDKYFNEIEINYTISLTKSFELGASYLYNKTLYKDVAKVPSTDKREDILEKYSAYVSYNVIKNIGVVVQYDNYNNETNYTPSDYKKEVLSVGVFFYY